jgi:subtilase family serine protease
MRTSKRFLRRRHVVKARSPGGILAVVTALAALCVLAVTSSSSAGGSLISLPAVQGPTISSLNGTAGTAAKVCPVDPTLTCYGPADLGKAYNFPSNLDGRGQTIIIVDAYGSPTIQADLTAFDTYFGIAAPPSFKIINARGTGETGSGDLTDWGVETSLDVEYAHAMAPGANIVLDVAASDTNDDLNAAEAQVFPQYPHSIISQSFGDWETDSTAGNSFQVEHKIFEQATAAGDTILASAGDAGATWTQYTGTTSPAIASYPASDPLVTGVGGTQGLPYPAGLLQHGGYGGYGGEQVWNEPQYDAATGGAPSILFQAPSWQQPFSHNRMRTVPDISYDAAVDGGVIVFASPYVYIVGGTSVGSPNWAAIIALADQARERAGNGQLGFANAALYSLAQQGSNGHHGFSASFGDSSSDFHDITVGNNALDSSVGFSAGPGYDLATGLGTPNVSNLVQDLATVNTGGNPVFGWPGFPNGNPFNPPSGGHHHAGDTMAPGL